MLVLTWNLFHGRADPPAGRYLLDDYAARLSAWAWDVALLQEVPPWWPPLLGERCGAHARTALTSRNEPLCVRKAIAIRFPDLIKSNGGGSNAILVRPSAGAITEHRRERLRWWPERRVAHAVRLEDGSWFGNLHAQVHSDDRAHADTEQAAAALQRWAGATAPLVLGGDLNVRDPRAGSLTLLAGHGVDHVLGRGWRAAGGQEVLPHAPLSDHAPVRVALQREPAI